MTARATRLGSFDDALADRLSEAAWLLSLWLVGGHGLLVVGCGALSWLHEYVRARGTAAGMASIGVVTANERPTRVIAVILALCLGGLAWLINPRLTPGTITVILAIWFLLALLALLRLTNTIRTSLRRPAP